MLSRALAFSSLCLPLAAAQSALAPAGQLMPATTGASSNTGGAGPAADNCAVLPSAFANAWANSYSANTNTPFSSAPMQYQQVFLGSQLPQSVVLRGLRLRRDDWQGRSSTGYSVDLQINLGFTSMTPATLTNTFASNFDRAAPVTVVPRQNITLPNMPSTLPTDPTVFFVQIPFAVPFPWPAMGSGQNLLLEVINRGNSNNNTAFTYYLDAVAGSSTFPVDTAKVYGTSTTGTVVRHAGLIVCFDGTGRAGLHTHFGTGCAGTGGLAGTSLPATLASSFGTGNNLIPFGYASYQYQQVFLASEVPASTTPMMGVSLRQDEFFGGYAAVTKDLEINLGYTSLTPATLTTTFASNFDSGPPAAVLPRQSVVLPAMPLKLPTDPSVFFARIPFANAFTWSPARGNLLIQITVHGGSALNALDAGNGSTARMWANSSTATTGSVDGGRNYGLAMFFDAPGRGRAVPWLEGSGRPVIGSSFDIVLSRALPAGAAVLLLGSSNTTWGAIPLPLDLTPLGAPGCRLLVAPDLGIFAFATDAAGGFRATLGLPSDAGLVGLHLYEQFASLDAAANALGLAFSRGGDAWIGGF